MKIKLRDMWQAWRAGWDTPLRGSFTVMIIIADVTFDDVLSATLWNLNIGGRCGYQVDFISINVLHDTMGCPFVTFVHRVCYANVCRNWRR